jgi:hypothetical protein
MKTVAVDLDGVVHEYSEGWRGGAMYDAPVRGAFEAIRTLQERGFAVFLFTARESLEPVAEWVRLYSTLTVVVDEPDQPERPHFWNDTEIVLITNRKLPAAYYVDDRAIRFVDWEQTLAQIT